MPPDDMLLGDKLRATIAEVAYKKEQELLREQADNAERERIRRTYVYNDLKNFQNQVVAAINMGNIPKPGKIHDDKWRDPSKNQYDLKATDPRHADNDIWVTYSDWFKEQRLELKLVYEHDGMGMKSWHVLAVEPIN